jgi:hypothetical protein
MGVVGPENLLAFGKGQLALGAKLFVRELHINSHS